MDDSAEYLSWQIEPDGLDRVQTSELRSAVEACAHWLEVWESYVRAAVAQPMTIVVTATDDHDVVVSADPEGSRVRVAVPRALLGAADLQSSLLVGALQAVDEAAQRFPHPTPPVLWSSSDENDENDEHRAHLGVVLECLDDEEMLLFGSTADANTDGLAALHALDDYVLDRVAGTQVAEVVDTAGGCGSATWTIAVTDAG